MIDSLDMHAVVGDGEGFREATATLLKGFESGVLTFDRDVVVSVFEASIRVLGGLVRSGKSVLSLLSKSALCSTAIAATSMRTRVLARVSESSDGSPAITFPGERSGREVSACECVKRSQSFVPARVDQALLSRTCMPLVGTRRFAELCGSSTAAAATPAERPPDRGRAGAQRKTWSSRVVWRGAPLSSARPRKAPAAGVRHPAWNSSAPREPTEGHPQRCGAVAR